MPQDNSGYGGNFLWQPIKYCLDFIPWALGGVSSETNSDGDAESPRPFLRNKLVKLSFTAADPQALGVRFCQNTRQGIDSRLCTTVSVIRPGSDADRAGLRVGARLGMVNGEDLSFKAYEEVMDILARSSYPTKLVFEQSELGFPMDNSPDTLTQFPPPMGTANPGFLLFDESNSDHSQGDRTFDSSVQLHPDMETPLLDPEDYDSKRFWMSDYSTKACSDCGRPFTLCRRRHHCRSCGQVFCAQCITRIPKSVVHEEENKHFAWLRKQIVCYICCEQLQDGLQIALSAPTVPKASIFHSTEVLQVEPTKKVPLAMPRPPSSLSIEIARLPSPPLLDGTVGSYTSDKTDDDFSFDEDGTADDRQRGPLWNAFEMVQIASESKRQNQYRQPLNRIATAESTMVKGIEATNDLAPLRRTNSTPEVDMRKSLLEESDSMSVKSFNAMKALRRTDSTSAVAEGQTNQLSPPMFLLQEDEECEGEGKERRCLHTGKSAYLHGDMIKMDTFGSDPPYLDPLAHCVSERPEYLEKKAAIKKVMLSDARAHVRSVIDCQIRKNDVIPESTKDIWSKTIGNLCYEAGMFVSPQPQLGESRDVLQYTKIKLIPGGEITDSAYIDGVVFHKSLARKEMRSQILNPRILLIASSIEFQRQRNQIASLEAVGMQDYEYMHLIVAKIMTLRPDVVLLGGHVDMVAESLLSKKGVSLVKNVKEDILKRVARSTGAAVVLSPDHVDKVEPGSVIGHCGKFEMISYAASKVEGANTKKRSRKMIVLSGCNSSRGCTVLLRGGSLSLLQELRSIVSLGVKTMYNSRLQVSYLSDLLLQPPKIHSPSSGEDRAPSTALYLTTGKRIKPWRCRCNVCNGKRLALFLSSNNNNLRTEALQRRIENGDQAEKSSTAPSDKLAFWLAEVREPYVGGAKGIASSLHSKLPFAESTGGSFLSMSIAARSSTGTLDALDLPPTHPGAPSLQGSFYKRFRTRNNRPSAQSSGSKDRLRLRRPPAPGADEQSLGRIIISCCWKGVKGRQCSPAELKCINFYESNDYTLGEFLMKQCFDPNNKCRTCKRAFAEHEFSFSHENSRLSITVIDTNSKKQPLEDNHILAGLQLDPACQFIRQEVLTMWSVSLAASNRKAYIYTVMSDDTWNYSFGRFLEEIFYSRGMTFDTDMCSYHEGIKHSADPRFVRFFGYAGLVARFQYDIFMPIKEVALRPSFWEVGTGSSSYTFSYDRPRVEEIIKKVGELTLSKIEQSIQDPLLATSALALKEQKREVIWWQTAMKKKLDEGEFKSIVETNLLVRQVWQQLMKWNESLGSLLQRPLKVSMHSDVKAGLPAGWMDRLDMATERGTNTSRGSGGRRSDPRIGEVQGSSALSVPPAPSAFVEDTGGKGKNKYDAVLSQMMNPEAVKNLGAAGRWPAPLPSLPSPVIPPLPAPPPPPAPNPRTTLKEEPLPHSDSFISASPLRGVDLSSWRTALLIPRYNRERDRDKIEAPNSNTGADNQDQGHGGAAAGQRSRPTKGFSPPLLLPQQNVTTIPQELLEWNPQLPPGLQDTVVLVNEGELTSIAAYLLASSDHAECVQTYLTRAKVMAPPGFPFHRMDPPEVRKQYIKILRRAGTNVEHRTDVKEEFGGEYGGKRFKCRAYFALQFCLLRRLCFGSDQLFVESLSRCQTWASSGGKSGARFMKTLDDRFIAKEIPRMEVDMFVDMAKSYFEHLADVLDGKKLTMLCKTLGLFEITRMSPTGNETTYLMVTENLTYGRELDQIFDLKGKLEGRYTSKAEARTPGITLLDGDLMQQSKGLPTPLNEQAYAQLLAAAESDTKFLESVNVTDYSMLVGFDIVKQEMVAGIIDYVHQYVLRKRLEYMGKKLYQVEQEITVQAPADYARRFKRAVRRYFTPIPSRLTRPVPVSSDDKEQDRERESSVERDDPSFPRSRTSSSSSLSRLGTNEAANASLNDFHSLTLGLNMQFPEVVGTGKGTKREI